MKQPICPQKFWAHAMRVLITVCTIFSAPFQLANAENGRGRTGPEYTPYLIYQAPATPSFGAYVHGAVVVDGEAVSGAVLTMMHGSVGPITATTMLVPQVQSAYPIYMFGAAPSEIGATYGSVVSITVRTPNHINPATGQPYFETRTVILRPAFEDLLPMWFVFGTRSPVVPKPPSPSTEITPTLTLTTVTENRQLSVGLTHACAVVVSSVWCWGNNDLGQLGDNKGWINKPPTMPWPMSDLPVQPIGLTGVRAIASGLEHSCALLQSGRVSCWGRWGARISMVPTDIIGIDNAVDLVSGAGFSCAIIAPDRSVRCWGENNWGQLGDGTYFTSMLPTAVLQKDGTPLKGVERISVSYAATCAVTKGGTQCWGVGAEVLPTNTATTTNRSVIHIVPNSGVVDISLGFGFDEGCVILDTRQVKCWGRRVTPNSGYVPVLIPNLEAAKIDLGYFFACALTTRSEVKCWAPLINSSSYVNKGQLGSNVLLSTTQPILITGLPTDITDLSAGWSSVCARTSVGKVYCWGDNGYGQLGTGSLPTITLAITTASALPPNLKQISVGVEQTCGINASSRLVCVGSNLRQDLISDVLTHTVSSAVEIAGLGPISTTAASRYHTIDQWGPTYLWSAHRCAVKTDGTVWCWGGNGYGQLGDGTKEFRKTPVQVIGLSNIRSVVAGATHTCALTQLGGVKCWGGAKVIGNGSVNQALAPADVVGLSAGVVSLTAGREHTCAILISGAAKCWGVNSPLGWLGVGSTADVITTPLTVTGLTSGVSAITGGWQNTCAVVNGAAKCWGYLGVHDAYSSTQPYSQSVPYTIPTNVKGLSTGVVDIKIGLNHYCALTTLGAVQCWGYYIGDSRVGGYSQPITVTGLTSNVVSIDLLFTQSCALLNTGQAKCWAYGRYGEMGDGKPTISPVPVQVVGLQPAKWTYMLYLSGDNDLSSYLDNVSRQLDQLPRSGEVSVVVLYDGAGKDDAYLWTTKYGKEYRENFNRWKLIEAESNMGDGKTLQNFIEWAHANFPAQHYYLSIANHGRGTSGIGWDSQNGPMSAADRLTPAEIRVALNAATQGSWKLDIVHFDACLMALIENAYQIKDYTRYMIASENLTFAFYPYDRYVQLAMTNPLTTPKQLAVAIANTYFDYEYLSLNNAPRTISVLDLEKINAVLTPFNTFANEMLSASITQSSAQTTARDATQKFDASPTLSGSVPLYLTITNDDEYVDLRDLASQISTRSSGAIQTAAQNLVAVLAEGSDNFVVLNRKQSGIDKLVSGNEWKLDRSNGVAVYFPRQPGAWDYTAYISHTIFSFTQANAWAPFLQAYFAASSTISESVADPGVPPVIRASRPITDHCPSADANVICVWGVVYSNTLPLTGAVVGLLGVDGTQIGNAQTKWISDSESQPIYAIAAEPGLVIASQPITLVVTHDGVTKTRQLRLTPQNGEQEVNITLDPPAPPVTYTPPITAPIPLPTTQIELSLAMVSPITVTSAISRVTFYAQADSSSSNLIAYYDWSVSAPDGEKPLGSSASFQLSPELLPRGQQTITVVAVGEDGNRSSPISRTVWYSPSYSITPTAGLGGSVTPDTVQKVTYTDDITFMVSPDVGYRIIDVRVDGVSKGAITHYVFEDVGEHHVISATFAKNLRYFYFPRVFK